MTGMSDERAATGAGDGGISDDDLADVLAAELERYATGAVPVLPTARPAAPAAPPVPTPGAGGPAAATPPPSASRAPVPPTVAPTPSAPAPTPSVTAQPPSTAPIQSLAVQGVDDAQPFRRPRSREEGPLAERAADIDRALRPSEPAQDTGSFRRPDRPAGRRSATGPVMQPTPMPTADDLPVKRRSGFRPPPTAAEAPPMEPLDRVLPPTGPVTLPEPTASLLEAMISDSEPVRPARHAAPPTDPVRRVEPTTDALRTTGQMPVPGGLYADWERSLRSIGRPRAPWEQDEPVVPTGGDPDLATVAVPIQTTGPVGTTLPPRPSGPIEIQPPRRGAHAAPVLPVEPVVQEVPDAPLPRRRSGRRRAAVPEPDPDPERGAPEPDLDEVLPTDVDAEGIDEVAVDYPMVSAATTGAIDLPATAPRPRTAPVIIERVRTAILQLPSVPTAPTGSGAAAIAGRWLGAFASPLLLVLAFGLAAAGAGAGAAIAALAGVLPALPGAIRSAAWSASAADDAELQESGVVGAAAGRVVATVLLLVRIGAAAVVLLLAGSAAGAWADRTGAFGLSAANASLVGCAAVGLAALFVSALPTRVTAVLVALTAVLGAVGTALLALVLAPTGGDSVATTTSGVVAAVAAGFTAIGLLLVLCGADIARWRTAIANPASSAVGAAAAAVLGGLLLVGTTVIAARLGGPGPAADGFAAALSDASASALAAPLLVVLVAAAVTLPALVLRSAGATAARLVGGGRPVGLGTVATGLLALAAALAVLAAGTAPDDVAVAAAGLLGMPLAAWAGALVLPPASRGRVTAIGLGVGAVVGLVLADGLVPGATSPVLDLVGVAASTGLRGGPAVGLAAAFVLGVAAAAAGGIGAVRPMTSAADPADTVEG
jgi:hypothetical protein